MRLCLKSVQFFEYSLFLYVQLLILLLDLKEFFLPALLIEYKGPKNKLIAVSSSLWHSDQANSGCQWTLYFVSFTGPNLSSKHYNIKHNIMDFLREEIFSLMSNVLFSSSLKVVAFLFTITPSLHNIGPLCKIWVILSFELHGFNGLADGE